MYLMQISTHRPESCPMMVESNLKKTATMLQKMDSLMAKHGIKLVASYTDFPAHVIYNTYEAPNMETFEKFSKEPEMMAWLGFNRVTTTVVMSLPEVKAMLNVP